MSKNLYQASNQWANRPDDERFASLEEAYAVTRYYADSAHEVEVPFFSIRLESFQDQMLLTTKMDQPGVLTHHAFNQICKRVDAPADHYRKLPATLAANNLNYFLARDSGQNRASILMHRNGHNIARAVTTEKYSRIWNYEVIERLIELRETQGWRVPPARPAHEGQAGSRQATEADVLMSRAGGGGLSINVGDWIAPAGIYASDHDMFVVMVNENIRIDDGTPEGLSRGIMVANGEVGDKSLWKLEFDYRHVCGNHIFWQVTNITEISIRHVGTVRDRFNTWEVELKYYLEQGTLERQEQVKTARFKVLGKTKQQVLDALFKVKTGLSKQQVSNAYDLAEMNVDRDGSPRTLWGMIQGVTRLAQLTPYGNERLQIERTAPKLLQLASGK